MLKLKKKSLAVVKRESSGSRRRGGRVVGAVCNYNVPVFQYFTELICLFTYPEILACGKHGMRARADAEAGRAVC